MAIRRDVLATGEIYHIFNRSVANESLFPSKRELYRAFELLNYYRFSQNLRYSKFKQLSIDEKKNYILKIDSAMRLVEIYAYSFMPNHYHFLVRQLKEDGIKKFISNIQNSFARYFNEKNSRHGSLFQNPFSARRIGTDEEFIHVSRYIHLNPVSAFIIEFENLFSDLSTSFTYYAGDREKNSMVNTRLILELVGSKDKYIEFVRDRVNYQRELGKIRHLILE